MLDETVPGQSRDRLLAKERLELGGSINRYLNCESEQCGHVSIDDE